ncbi:hypothetical protein TH66_16205 [Carbonactinospora thermoautotrophica]|uniref:DUF4440 domain-containing protein n=2 Tax=Carbonactinospora thermoautotrophica TaxID=1469144 RepID=A0A132MRK7_9ACTN|nr:SgcJ/EcaC family oxidoreductase [Carbonactinospora thermoautotrophica]KWX00360.1 hypothetical protein TH66_16205 [Carbonactinospora thermoautotrophica]
MPRPDAHTEAELRDVVSRMNESWTRGDADAYAALFTEDSDYVAFDGTRQRGRQANADSHRKLFAGVLKDSRLQGEVESIRLIAPDVAVVHAVGTVLLAWHTRPARRRLSRQTLVLVRENGRWRITAFHNTRVRPVPTEGPMYALATRLFRLRAALANRRAR